MMKVKYLFKNIWVFIPCHNEEDNIKPLVEEILDLKLPNFHIVIINDNSIDKTAQIADKLAQKYKNKVEVFHRKLPKGRALAGKDGFKFCLEKNADVIMEMDADFSHQPKYIPILLNELSNPKVDVVLGSRFLPGGSDSDRSPFRTTISKVSGIIFRLILGLKLTDMGSGFKAYKVKVIEKIKPNEFFSEKGLAISMESIFRTIKSNFKVKEIPIIFIDRKMGVSKMTWKDFFEPVIICFQLVLKLGRAQQ